MSQPNSAPIKRVVVLMFENRSFDHLLGAMPGVNGLFDAQGALKPEIYNSPDPTAPPAAGQRQVPFPITPGPLEHTYTVNGDHDFDAMMTDLAGPGTTGVAGGLPQANPWPTYPTTNSGFVRANPEDLGTPAQHPVMSYFAWGSMQVFHQLAQEFVVCDNWFCDMPSHTAPNRAFMHCATTGDLQIDNNDAANEQDPNGQEPSSGMVNQVTIFERLEQYGHTWKMYLPGGLNDTPSHNNLDTDYLNLTVSQRYWTHSTKYQTNCTDVPLTQFYQDVQNHDLPTYSFIMCWDHPQKCDTSMHPYSSVMPGENLLAAVYNALRQSRCWDDTLLIVNFDENGGLYDHVRPPRAVPPFPEAAAQQTVINGTTYSFDYSILGFRIPTLLISPWLRAGIESQQLQNTSILRFLQDQFCATGAQPSFLTQRDRFANSLQVAFDDLALLAPRPDCLASVTPYPDAPYAEGLASPPAVTPAQRQTPPAPYLVDMALEYVRGLPGHPDTGRRVAPSFATTQQLLDYVAERRQAALATTQPQPVAAGVA